MRNISKLGLAVAAALILGGAAGAGAQPAGTPKTSNPVPMDCARLADPAAKAECVRAQERQRAQERDRKAGQGQVQGTGVGKGKGQGAGVGQGSGQGASKGTGQLKKN
ncbi:MAG: hypothetical protein KIT20_05310 [Alphaproteobacteria bacterium]|nr:hypothetical protein [Alphaproteobacteria bacterium]